jgi:hypothetical protein
MPAGAACARHGGGQAACLLESASIGPCRMLPTLRKLAGPKAGLRLEETASNDTQQHHLKPPLRATKKARTWVAWGAYPRCGLLVQFEV